MKKRFISMLLVVLMVMSLFTGVSTSASAAGWNGANTIEYTMQNGDYVLRICQKLGLNYYTCKQAIMDLNSIKEGEWNKLAVGRVLTLPASDQDAILLTSGAPTTVQTTGTAVTGTGVTGTATAGTATAVATSSTVGNVSTSPSADVLVYYLVPYTMSVGETVSGVCNNLGVNFSVFQSFIQQVNDISSWNKVRAGQTLIIPTPVRPAVGTSCYGVMAHSVASNDTAYSITSKAGVNYNSNKRLLEALNQTSNLGAIKAGDKFYYPRPMTISVPGTDNPGSTTTTTTTTTTTDGNGTTVTQTTVTGKLYTLTSNMSSSDGTMLFYVDSKPVTAAQAGAKVTILTDTASGKAIQSLTVKHSNGTADLLLTGDSFIMPGCDVRVDASMKTGHDITIEANYSGKANASVGGVSVQSAVKGAAVIIKSTDPNYEIENVYAYYKRFSWLSTKTPLTITGNGFAMPDMDVTVEVTLKPVTTYAFYVRSDITNEGAAPAFSTRWGTFFLEVNGAAATRAARGTKVSVVPRADEGYEPFRIVVQNRSTGAAVNVFSNTFTMPASDVDVWVYFTPKGNNIIIQPAQGGTANATVGGPPAIDEAASGTVVTLTAVPDPGYQFNRWDIVRNSDGLKIDAMPNVNANPATFVMPKGGVTVTPVFIGANSFNITSNFFIDNVATPANTYRDVSFYASFTDPQSTTGATVKSEFRWTNAQATDADVFGTKYPVAAGRIFSGTYIDLTPDCAEGLAFVKFEIWPVGGANPLEEETNSANFHGYFLMPTQAIEIRAFFETGKVAIGPATIEGVGSVSFLVSDDGGINWRSAATCNPGDLVRAVLIPGEGYRFDWATYNAGGNQLLITRKDNGASVILNPAAADMGPATPPNSRMYQFQMPAEGVNIKAIFDPAPYTLTMTTIDEFRNPLNGRGIWQIAINGVVGAVDNDPMGPTTVNVEYGDTVVVAMTESGWSNYDMVSFRINDKEYIADVHNYFYSFEMVGDRAQNLNIVATVQPRVPYSPVAHALNASYDTSKGNVEFLIVNSPTGYSDTFRVDAAGANLVYVKNAVYGDQVAIVWSSTNYSIDLDHILIEGSDASKIVPTFVPNLQAIDGRAPAVAGYVFEMPETDVTITINFFGQPLATQVNVVDQNGNPITGMVKLSVNGGVRDAALPATFNDIAYKSEVALTRTELARAENIKITGISVLECNAAMIPLTDADGAQIRVPVREIVDGYQFTMPNNNIQVNVIVGPDDQNWDIQLTNGLTLNGGFIFRDAPGGNIITSAKPGDVVYVFDNPNAGYCFLGGAGLKITDPGTQTDIKQIVADGTGANPNLNTQSTWKFTMPNYGVSFDATFVKQEYTLRFNQSGTVANWAVTKNYGTAKPVTAGDTMTVSMGDYIAITTINTGDTFVRMDDDAPGLGLITTPTSSVWTIPAFPAGVLVDDVFITVN